jgi:adenylate cyclase class 2
MSQSQSHYEIEIKYRLKDPRALRTRLKKLGAKKLGVDSERNELYDDAAGGLKKRGCALRVRQTQSDKALLTYKGPVSKGPVKRRLEIETDADPAAIRRILVYLGFQPKLRYDKVRETYGLRSCLVTIDRLKGHGFFSEIEGPRAAILKLEKALGFEVRDREDRTYAQIVKN